MKTFFKGNNLQSECKMHSIKRCQVCSHNMHVFRDKIGSEAIKPSTVVNPSIKEIRQLAHKAFLSTDTLVIYSTLSHLLERIDQLEEGIAELAVSVDSESAFSTFKKIRSILGCD